jgi:RNA polymerase sigma-70 factor (ECF subfamily)
MGLLVGRAWFGPTVDSDPPASVSASTAHDADTVAGAHWLDAYRVAYLLLHNERDAEDVAQDSIIRAVAALETFDGRRPLQPWIERIAANAAIDHLRARGRRAELLVADTPDDLGADSDDVGDAISRAALPDELLSALRQLELPQRTAVVLRHLLDYEPSEIAELLQTTPGAVRVRIHRGLENLRLILETNKEAEPND